MDMRDPSGRESCLGSQCHKGTLKQWYGESRTRDKAHFAVGCSPLHARGKGHVSYHSQSPEKPLSLPGAYFVCMLAYKCPSLFHHDSPGKCSGKVRHLPQYISSLR